MKIRIGLIVAVACAASTSEAGGSALETLRVPRPFFEARKQRNDYAGPGHELAPPEDLREVLIGYFGPGDPSDPKGGDMWLAARLAIDETNKKGGYRGSPYRLVPGWSTNPWGSGVSTVTRMVYDDNVWAIIGGIDGPSTHLAEQVVAKARVVLISPGSTDKSVNLAHVPWMFSIPPGDHLLAPVLANGMAADLQDEPFVVVSANDHDSRLFTVELVRGFRSRGISPAFQFTFDPGNDLSGLLSRIVEAKPQAVVVVAGLNHSARLVRALRNAIPATSIYGGPAMSRRTFLEQAGSAAEGVVFPLTGFCDRAGEEFSNAFRKRFGRQPDDAAAHTYDSVRLLVDAIERAGLNRARIRDAVRDLAPWSGVAGIVKWDSLGSNTRPAVLGTIRKGRVVPLRPPRNRSKGDLEEAEVKP